MSREGDWDVLFRVQRRVGGEQVSLGFGSRQVLQAFFGGWNVAGPVRGGGTCGRSMHGSSVLPDLAKVTEHRGFVLGLPCGRLDNAHAAMVRGQPLCVLGLPPVLPQSARGYALPEAPPLLPEFPCMHPHTVALEYMHLQALAVLV